MDKKPPIGVSILAVVLLVLGSLSNVMGYQAVQTSQQNLIKERINQRELLFQTIVDIANNKEIQRIVLKSQMSKGIFPTSEFPVITKNQIRQIYFLGLMLSKVISKSRIQSIVGKYQLMNPEIQKGITTVIEKDTTINSEITQLKDSECDCENKSINRWRYPALCSILSVIFFSLGVTFVFFDKVISDGLLWDNPILILMAVLIWIETGALLTTVDCLFNIYCGTESLVLGDNIS